MCGQISARRLRSLVTDEASQPVPRAVRQGPASALHRTTPAPVSGAREICFAQRCNSILSRSRATALLLTTRVPTCIHYSGLSRCGADCDRANKGPRKTLSRHFRWKGHTQKKTAISVSFQLP